MKVLDIEGDSAEFDKLFAELKASGMREFTCADCGARGLTRMSPREIDRCPPCDQQVDA